MSRSKPPLYDYRTMLSYRVLLLSNTLSKGAARLYAGRFGLPLAEWRLLAALAIDAPTSPNRLAASLGADKGWVSRTLASLARKRLTANGGHPGDARRIEIQLTAEGRALYRRILPAALERQRSLRAAFSAAEERMFRRLLDRLQQRAEAASHALERPGSTLLGRQRHESLRPRRHAGSRLSNKPAMPSRASSVSQKSARRSTADQVSG